MTPTTPAPDYPDAPAMDIRETLSRVPPHPIIYEVWVACPWCGTLHLHGGLGLRASSCGKSYYVGGQRP